MRKLLLLLVAVSAFSCEVDACTECYDVTTTIYYPEFEIITETVCVDYDCDYGE